MVQRIVVMMIGGQVAGQIVGEIVEAGQRAERATQTAQTDRRVQAGRRVAAGVGGVQRLKAAIQTGRVQAAQARVDQQIRALLSFFPFRTPIGWKQTGYPQGFLKFFLRFEVRHERLWVPESGRSL